MPERIVDTHIHIWNFNRAKYSWLDHDRSILNRNYSVEEIEDERRLAGVTEGVLVQAANNFEDTDYMLEVAENTDWVSGVVGWLPLTEPDVTAYTLINKYSRNKYIKGVRHLIHNEPEPRWLLQDKVIESLKILAEYNLPYDLVGISTEHIETALALANKIPGLKMVFDHLNQPPISTSEKFGLWGELMSEAAKHQNFYAKISGLGAASKMNKEWRAEDIEPYIDFAFTHFGEDRCFCGADWPVSLLSGNYTKSWDAYKSVLGSLLDREGQEKVFYENAVNFYNLTGSENQISKKEELYNNGYSL